MNLKLKKWLVNWDLEGGSGRMGKAHKFDYFMDVRIRVPKNGYANNKEWSADLDFPESYDNYYEAKLYTYCEERREYL